MRTLKLTDQDSLYSNLGLLLSDQCVHTIKVAVFQGTDQTIFKDRREFTGSLMQQMNEVYDFIDFRNQTRATIEKLLRIDVKDYPEIAVREALLNLLVHRLWKAFHNRCYAKLIVMQSWFQIPHKIREFGTFCFA